MSHLSEVLDQQSWLTTAATDISQTLPAGIEQQRKRLELEAIEQKERACGYAGATGATFSSDPTGVFAHDNPLHDETGD